MLVTKPPLCKQCKKRLPDFQTRIHPECVDAFADKWFAKAQASKKRLAAQAKREERAKIKERKQRIKTRSEWIAECQALINRYCRLRDKAKGYGCISCGIHPEERFGGAADAGHFRSVGSAPHMRFMTNQIHLQCVKCNRYLGSNAVEYRKGLIARIGLEAVERIEADQAPRKFDIDHLKRLKSVVSKKIRRLIARHG